MTTSSLRSLFQTIVPDEQIHSEHAVREQYAQDKWHAKKTPELVLEARSTEQVSAILQCCHEQDIKLTTRGAGVGYVGGAVPIEGGVVLALAGMDQILSIEPENGLAIVQPGVITAQLQRAAQEHGWYYPPDPASLNECSIGGNIATNAGGPRCLKYGVTKQYVLGLTVVLADGTVLRVGGKCHKNKTGYDLVSLFVGSEGTLGVVTEAIVRIIPHPESRAMLSATFPSFELAAAAVAHVLDSGHLPSALEITDGFTLAAARKRLGTQRVPDGNAHLMLEIDGRKQAVLSELTELEKLLHSHQALSLERALEPAACEANWQMRREFSYSLRDTGLTKLNEDVVVPRSKLVELVHFSRKLQEQTGIDIATFGHAGDGNLHVNLMVADYEDKEVQVRAHKALDSLFHWIIDNEGAITGEHGVGLAKQRWFAQAVGESSLLAHKTIKDALDPKGILNPGKIWQTGTTS